MFLAYLEMLLEHQGAGVGRAFEMADGITG